MHGEQRVQGVYKPRRPQALPLFRLVSDHLHRLQRVYGARFARAYGPRRRVVAQTAGKFLACRVLEHGFARIRCDDGTHEYLLAVSCKWRYFCPSCHATFLAPVPHRQVVLAIPKPAARELSVPPPARRDRPRRRPHRSDKSGGTETVDPLAFLAVLPGNGRAARESYAGPRSPPSTRPPHEPGYVTAPRVSADAPTAP